MGNNESLPPLPRPVPLAPPAGPPAYQPPPPPAYNPPAGQFPSTTQIPVTGALPPTQAYPGGPPGGFPPQGSTSFEPPDEPPKKKTGLMIVGGLAAVAVIVAGVLVLSDGRDDTTVSPGTTFPEATVLATIPDVTLLPDDTLVITLPVITELAITEPAIAEPAITDPAVRTTVLSGGEITDDLRVFAVVLPDGLAVDTPPITTQDNFTLPSIAGAVDLQGFYNDDVTPGMTLVVVGKEVDSTPAEVLAFLEPGADICTGREETADYPTTIGAGILLKLDGCGPDGTAAKVFLVAAIPGSTVIAAIYLQGLGLSADLLPQAQTVFETVRLL